MNIKIELFLTLIDDLCNSSPHMCINKHCMYLYHGGGWREYHTAVKSNSIINMLGGRRSNI